MALVNIPVIISHKKGRSVSGLTIEDFTLLEDGKPHEIEYLLTQDSPLNIILLLDMSRSTKEIIEKIKSA